MLLQAMKVELGIYSCFAEAAVQEPVPSNVAEASVAHAPEARRSDKNMVMCHFLEVIFSTVRNRKHTEFG